MEIHTPARGQDLQLRSALFLVRARSFSFTHLISNKDTVYIILRGAVYVGEDLGHIFVSDSGFIPGKHLEECLTL